MRNGNRLYTYNQSLDKTQFKVRMPKIYNDKYQLEVKHEIARISDKIKTLKRTERKSHQNDQKIYEFMDDLDFWKSEMAKFDNNQTHKLLKSRKSYDDKYLYDFTIDYINKQIPIDESHGRYPYITKEEIAKVLKCKPSDLDKMFMRLNREGILSQAKHRRMHDTARYGNIEETLSYDYGNSDWTPDAYDILAKAPVLTA